MELLELVELLADRHELDRHAGDGPHGERRAAARVAVELRHHEAVEGDPLAERLGHVDRVLAGHRVEHEQRVGGLDRVAHAHELVHQLGVDVQAAGGVDDHDVAPLLARLPHAPLGDVDRVGVGALLVDRHAGLRADGLQLVDGRRAVDVAGHQRRLLALLGQQPRELARRRRLARALQAAHEDHRGRLRRELELRGALAHQRGQLLQHDLHDLLARREALQDVRAARALAHRGHEVLDDAEVDVGLEQREADLAHGARDVVLGQAPAAAQVAERRGQPVGEGVEHVVQVYRRPLGAGSGRRDGPVRGARSGRDRAWFNAVVEIELQYLYRSTEPIVVPTELAGFALAESLTFEIIDRFFDTSDLELRRVGLLAARAPPVEPPAPAADLEGPLGAARGRRAAARGGRGAGRPRAGRRRRRSSTCCAATACGTSCATRPAIGDDAELEPIGELKNRRSSPPLRAGHAPAGADLGSADVPRRRALRFDSRSRRSAAARRASSPTSTPTCAGCSASASPAPSTARRRSSACASTPRRSPPGPEPPPRSSAG